jgi:hypothetical protein
LADEKLADVVSSFAVLPQPQSMMTNYSQHRRARRARLYVLPETIIPAPGP